MIQTYPRAVIRNRMCREHLVKDLAGEVYSANGGHFYLSQHCYPYSYPYLILAQAFKNPCCVPSPVLYTADAEIIKTDHNNVTLKIKSQADSKMLMMRPGC